MKSRVYFSFMDLEEKIEGLHSDYYYLLEEIETELHKEINGRDLVFYLDDFEDLGQVEDDIKTLISEIEKVIESEEIEGGVQVTGIDSYIEHQEWIRSRQ